MTNNTYIFSWSSQRLAPRIKRREWWNIFGRDTIERVIQIDRFEAHGVTEEETRILMAARWTDSTDPLSRLLLRLMGDQVSSIQLEVSNIPSKYVKS